MKICYSALSSVLLWIIFFTSIISFQNAASQNKSLVKTETEYAVEMKGGKEIQIKRHFRSYDEKGNILDEIDYDNDGKPKEETRYDYDNRNQKIKETHVQADGKIDEISTYEYDQKGNRVSKIVTDGNKKLKSKKKFVYEYY